MSDQSIEKGKTEPLQSNSAYQSEDAPALQTETETGRRYIVVNEARVYIQDDREETASTPPSSPEWKKRKYTEQTNNSNIRNEGRNRIPYKQLPPHIQQIPSTAAPRNSGDNRHTRNETRNSSSCRPFTLSCSSTSRPSHGSSYRDRHHNWKAFCHRQVMLGDCALQHKNCRFSHNLQEMTDSHYNKMRSDLNRDEIEANQNRLLREWDADSSGRGSNRQEDTQDQKTENALLQEQILELRKELTEKNLEFSREIAKANQTLSEMLQREYAKLNTPEVATALISDFRAIGADKKKSL
jgi:hypothetical protein